MHDLILLYVVFQNFLDNFINFCNEITRQQTFHVLPSFSCIARPKISCAVLISLNLTGPVSLTMSSPLLTRHAHQAVGRKLTMLLVPVSAKSCPCQPQINQRSQSHPSTATRGHLILLLVEILLPSDTTLWHVVSFSWRIWGYSTQTAINLICLLSRCVLGYLQNPRAGLSPSLLAEKTPAYSFLLLFHEFSVSTLRKIL